MVLPINLIHNSAQYPVHADVEILWGKYAAMPHSYVQRKKLDNPPPPKHTTYKSQSQSKGQSIDHHSLKHLDGVAGVPHDGLAGDGWRYLWTSSGRLVWHLSHLSYLEEALEESTMHPWFLLPSPVYRKCPNIIIVVVTLSVIIIITNTCLCNIIRKFTL